MILKAVIKLQNCTTKKRQAFVVKQYSEHGIAKGRVERWELVASSWAHGRRLLKSFDVMGFTNLDPKTVESFTTDIGSLPASLRKL